ncbi:SAM-dependent methyltransferase [Streptomyces sp. NBC_01363]|uniref:SAM-dependent methyltransferase n=1 Tax=Streptomyces sp. NBC_01363 TaxID=2903840 RepID=UPI002B1D471F|nr:SAM-dependent methyltransferase [Streptomyces sp. NBC_01363]
MRLGSCFRSGREGAQRLWQGEGLVESRPIARVAGGRSEICESGWGREEAIIRLDSSQFGPEALFGLDGFSHLEVVFFFDQVDSLEIDMGARPVPGRHDGTLVGIFAQRSRYRPNRLGVSRCRITSVNNLDVHVSGLDAVSGTPVLDLKPYVREFGPRGEIQQPEWASTLMRDYY